MLHFSFFLWGEQEDFTQKKCSVRHFTPKKGAKIYYKKMPNNLPKYNARHFTHSEGCHQVFFFLMPDNRPIKKALHST